MKRLRNYGSIFIKVSRSIVDNFMRMSTCATVTKLIIRENTMSLLGVISTTGWIIVGVERKKN
ncbi:hypothetical protein BDF14DRAFT_915829 [Spinellus fusiger]|nr:hypothetical protein BDF14DRAFT_915829 [Spinellus fusiger]